LALLFLMGVCPLIAWRRASGENLQRNFLYPLLVSFVGAGILVAQGMRQIGALLTLILIFFVLATIVLEFYRGTMARRRMAGEGYLTAFVNLIWKNKRRYGGYIIHIGVIMMFFAAAGGPFKVEVEETLRPGESMVAGNYKVVFDRMWEQPQEKKLNVLAAISIFDNKTDKRLGSVTPRKEYYEDMGGGASNQPWTRVAVRATFKEDLYFIFSPDEQGREMAGFKVLVNPLMRWMWLAGFVMTFGTIIAVWPDEGEKRRMAMIYAKGTAKQKERVPSEA
jgi:cytochrome c-type biogenesis protein CcmF